MDVDQLSAGKLFIVLLVQDHNDISKIHHQLLCQIHDVTDLLQISLVNDGKIELGVVFGHRLVYAAPIGHKLFLDLNNHELLNPENRAYIAATKIMISAKSKDSYSNFQ